MNFRKIPHPPYLIWIPVYHFVKKIQICLPEKLYLARVGTIFVPAIVLNAAKNQEDVTSL